MRNRKRLTSLILAAVMLCALLAPSISPAYAASQSEITQQIRNTYQASLQKAGRSSFNGYCGLYVNWQLVILGINSSYVGGNGNDEYDNYCNLSQSSGGYSIAAYPASQYSLQSALNAISANGTRDVTNILVGFEKGSGSDGALYGHTCFIHAIIDGNVYFSESFNATVGGTYYAEGSPIVCSISTFCSYYGSWTVLDGVIHFGTSTISVPQSPKVVTDKSTYTLGETVTVTPSADGAIGYNVSIWLGAFGTGEQVYGNYDCFTGSITFTPERTGTYTVRASCINNAGYSDAECTFKVVLPTYKVYFDANGGTLDSDAFATRAIDGINSSRPAGTLIVYNQEERIVDTNAFGAEVAVDANGKVIAKRNYGDENQLTVPKEGFVLSGHIDTEGCGGNFVKDIEIGDFVAYSESLAEAYIYKSQNTYLAAQKHVSTGSSYGLLPTPERSSYTFDGWYTAGSGGSKVTSSTTVTATSNHTLYAHWVQTTSHTHTYSEHVVLPTCTERGYTTHTCECGDSYVDSYTDALGHAWDNGVVTKQPTETENGIRTLTCIRCDATKTETIPATGDKPCDGGEGCPSGKFVDVNPKKWYHPYVDYAVTHGLFGGTSKNTFEPETAMTRAMLVTVLWRYEGRPKGYENTFTDVNAKSGSWYIDAVAWAAANGVVNGVGNGKFDPQGKVTREQMAAILFRYAQKKGIDTSKRDSLGAFPDATMVSTYAKDAMQWAVAEKIINGSDGKLLPKGNATRAQVATILMRFIENIVNQ